MPFLNTLYGEDREQRLDKKLKRSIDEVPPWANVLSASKGRDSRRGSSLSVREPFWFEDLRLGIDVEIMLWQCRTRAETSPL